MGGSLLNPFQGVGELIAILSEELRKNAVCFKCRNVEAITVNGMVVCKHPDLSGPLKILCKRFEPKED